MTDKRLRTDLDTKACPKCGMVLGKEAFTPTNWKRNGKYCKPCVNAYYRGRRRERGPGYSTKFVKRRREALTDMVMEYKTERGCIFCGERHPAALDLHHRDPKSKIMHIRGMVDRTRPVAVIRAEMEKCDVVCSNCHRKLHYMEGGRVFVPPKVLERPEVASAMTDEVERRNVKYPVTLLRLA